MYTAGKNVPRFALLIFFVLSFKGHPWGHQLQLQPAPLHTRALRLGTVSG